MRETEALLDARERVLNTTQNQSSVRELQASQIATNSQTQAELDEREANLNTAEAALKEREAFIEKSENTIFKQGQQLQEWEVELAHLQDELKARG
mgnify:FL=1